MRKLQMEMASALGPLYLVASAAGLHGLYWQAQPLPLVTTADTAEQQVFAATQQQVREYLMGTRRTFDINLLAEGGVFQKSVWAELATIPYGTTISYKALAARVNNLNAYRAVGAANGRNPLCIIVPCHRVIAANGKLGGYAGGIFAKEQLLTLEKTGCLPGAKIFSC